MTDTVLSLALTLVILGGVTYGIVAFSKQLIRASWRQTTRIGRATMLLLPMLVGGLLSAVSCESLIEVVSGLTGGPKKVSLGVGAAFLLGMFSGSFATQIHSAVRSRIKFAAAKAIASDDAPPA
tara:strand:- start:3893 stop:4264 length:372 start_codon:yes stop_codon:yes gene_type:complete